jgi:sugar/nucleoside kinase (ribokinase family)
VTTYPVKHVVDPVGAGDAVDAGFLAGVLREYGLEDAL